jgi:lysozyme
MRINPQGLDIIKRFEGLRLEAYKCPAGVWTIGYGHTGDVKEGDVITEHQADVILELDCERFEIAVNHLAPRANDNQGSAMVCLAFNIGVAAFAKSSLLRKFKEGAPCDAEFDKWVKAKGIVLPGLVKRRVAERALFLTPVPK